MRTHAGIETLHEYNIQNDVSRQTNFATTSRGGGVRVAWRAQITATRNRQASNFVADVTNMVHTGRWGVLVGDVLIILPDASATRHPTSLLQSPPDDNTHLRNPLGHSAWVY